MGHPVYLIRHGQSEWNLRRLTQGQAMHPRLTGLGREQAEAAAELVARELMRRGERVARIVTSDLVRATETADIVAARLGGTAVRDPRLREQGLGDLEGRPYEETWAAAEVFDWSDPTVPIAGGESVMDVYGRMAGVIDGVIRESIDGANHGAVVLISHGDAIRAAIAHVNRITPPKADWVEVGNGAVVRIHDGITWLSS